jgi:hypothetical protein
VKKASTIFLTALVAALLSGGGVFMLRAGIFLFAFGGGDFKKSN